MFTHEEYALILAKTIAEIEKLGHLKGGEYSGDIDRLANFRRNGEALGLPMEVIWHTYAAKHWDALTQSIKDQLSGKNRMRLESLEGRCDDLIVYLVLFKCMLAERNHQPEPDRLKSDAGMVISVALRDMVWNEVSWCYPMGALVRNISLKLDRPDAMVEECLRRMLAERKVHELNGLWYAYRS